MPVPLDPGWLVWIAICFVHFDAVYPIDISATLAKSRSPYHWCSVRRVDKTCRSWSGVLGPEHCHPIERLSTLGRNFQIGHLDYLNAVNVDLQLGLALLDGGIREMPDHLAKL